MRENADGMTKQEWAEVEKRIMGGHFVELRIEGRVITLHLVRIKMRLVVAVYVDGEMRGKWLSCSVDCPERKFLRVLQRNLFSKKTRATLKMVEKKTPDLLSVDPSEKITVYHPWFTSVEQLRRQYARTFPLIELVRA